MQISIYNRCKIAMQITKEGKIQYTKKLFSDFEVVLVLKCGKEAWHLNVILWAEEHIY